jgi:hypothetical protein
MYVCDVASFLDQRHQNGEPMISSVNTPEIPNMVSDLTEIVIANIWTQCPHIIREAIEIIKHCHNFIPKDGCRLSKAWVHLFSFKPST